METRALFDLSGKTALVTGGGRGIGRMLVLGLAEMGCDLVISSRKLANCEEVAKEVEGLGRKGIAIATDMSKPAEVEALVAELDDRGIGLDILVNNAGVTWGAPVLEYPMEAWDKVYNVNVRSLWQLSQLVARRMKQAGGGNIINITSIGGFRGAPDAAQPAIAYNSSKGAIVTLTKDMAVKLAPFGIRVNAIAPGPFLTDMFSHIRDNEGAIKMMTMGIPLARVGVEDDLKGVVAFLASEASSYVTGQILAVDGGMLAR